MQEPIIAPWGLSISEADFEKLKAGFQPQDQDDKWYIYATEKRQSGAIYIHIARSATGKEFYVLVLKPNDGDRGSGAKIVTIAWEQNNGFHVSEEDAKKLVLIIVGDTLECDFDALPEYWDSSNLYPDAQLGVN